ncbi:hypothetical protein HOD75_03400 [archaeon]|jgi:hypothetical protein|nr:hypothetical protein [archaeon]MBT4241919.1 hypothetical protein [archaeon]MBT4418466.1 hypothetical protein [archaeon]
MTSVNETNSIGEGNGSLIAYAVALPRKFTGFSFYDPISKIKGIRAESPEKAVEEIVKGGSNRSRAALSLLETIFGGIENYALVIPEAPEKDEDTGEDLTKEQKFDYQRKGLACRLESHYLELSRKFQGDYPNEPDAIEGYRAMDEARDILHACGIREI